MVVLKLTITVFSAYIFKHSDLNDLIFFSHFKNVSVYDQKKPGFKPSKDLASLRICNKKKKIRGFQFFL